MLYALGVWRPKPYIALDAAARSITNNNTHHNNIHHVQIFASIS